MNLLKDLNIQPVTFFEVKGLFFVTLFPTIFQGFTTVLCGREKNTERILVFHDCMVCKGYGQKNCPYIAEGVKYYKHHVGNDYHSYKVVQRKVTPNPRWKQLTKEEKAELLKKVKESAKPITQYFGSS